MRLSSSQIDAVKYVTPRALRAYAEGLGWSKVDGVGGQISAYRSPDSESRQVIIPNNAQIDDYADRVAETVTRLAAFEGRPPQDVFDHVLLPPADVIGFREVSSEAEVGNVTLEHGLRVLEGAKRLLLTTAHSVIAPQAYHPRLSREDAKKFLSRCRVSTARGSFIVTVACQLDTTVTIPGMEPVPFTRRVTTLLLDTVSAMDRAVQVGTADDLLDPTKCRGLSANFCEGLTLMRPVGDHATLEVSAAWSRASLPAGAKPNSAVQLSQEVFELAEELAPKLRSVPDPTADWYLGFVKELCGDPSPNEPRPSGEVRFALVTQDQEFQARADLGVEEYVVALEAHRSSRPVQFRGVLYRQPRMNRIAKVTHFGFVGLG